ncbi:hypothetical protein [Spirillospora sp. NPDC047279]|uniref:hypothetical protein n=1 Tax=Spirillospora sp. NPDC047279 TaxID=3155478 RepID=UPI0033C59F2A
MREITMIFDAAETASIKVLDTGTYVTERQGDDSRTWVSISTPDELIGMYREDGYRLYSDRTFA